MSDQQLECKYCLEPISDNLKATPVIRPCNCNAYVHNKCLNSWNEQRDEDKTKCEICKSTYVTEKVTVFDRKACCLDIFKIFYIVFAILFVIFASPFVMFGSTLFINHDEDAGATLGIILGTIGFHAIWILTAAFTDKATSPIEYLDSTRMLKA